MPQFTAAAVFSAAAKAADSEIGARCAPLDALSLWFKFHDTKKTTSLCCQFLFGCANNKAEKVQCNRNQSTVDMLLDGK